MGSDARRWWILAAMTGTLSMILLDQTVVSVTLPTIQRDLDTTQTELQWVVNAYLLSLAALVAVGGRLADKFNRVSRRHRGADPGRPADRRPAHDGCR